MPTHITHHPTYITHCQQRGYLHDSVLMGHTLLHQFPSSLSPTLSTSHIVSLFIRIQQSPRLPPARVCRVVEQGSIACNVQTVGNAYKYGMELPTQTQ